MIELVFKQVVNYWLLVFVKVGYEFAQCQVAVLYLAYGIIITFGKNVNAMWKLSLPSNILFNKS